MTFKEMTEECIALLGEEYSASEEEVRSLHVRLGKCVNYAYERIARQYYHPVKTEKAVTDERCRLKKVGAVGKLLVSARGKMRGAEVAACSEREADICGAYAEQRGGNYIFLCAALYGFGYGQALHTAGEVSPTAYIFAALCIFMESEGRHEDAAVWNAQAEAALSGSIYRPAHPMPVRRWQ